MAAIFDVSLLTIVPVTVTAARPPASVFAAARPTAVRGAGKPLVTVYKEPT